MLLKMIIWGLLSYQEDAGIKQFWVIMLCLYHAAVYLHKWDTWFKNKFVSFITKTATLGKKKKTNPQKNLIYLSQKAYLLPE